ncbi:MAG: hypothetical protein U0S50_06410 [Sphingopyxis sp.]|uniref:hypothetical protein n=1 Tax=Sphingopyxis sp. TaxID=1908224 RepID=UPI002ABAEEC5|nr:hypothetical protein [Sphingopyxis sp.]MDZ3831434.1 hypothetical protein [Sphingopyxis sp.]
MSGSRTRLVNAVRRSMIQRAQLQRKLGLAKEEFRPGALFGRGKAQLGAKVDDAAHAVRQQVRDNRWPIALAAAAGLAWVFREPIKEHAPRLGRRIKSIADDIAARLHGSDAGDDSDAANQQDQTEEDENETLR